MKAMRNKMGVDQVHNGSMTCKQLFNNQSNLLNSSMRRADNHRLLRQDLAYSQEDFQDSESIDSPKRTYANPFLDCSGSGSPDGLDYDSGED